jgi:hypothetical protein
VTLLRCRNAIASFSKRTALRDRLNAAADAMDDRALEITVVQAEAIAAL